VKQLVVATTNQGKLAEIAAYLDGLVSEILSLADFPLIKQLLRMVLRFRKTH
jgi:inosine/xanthosine triphosphate pyrophosphatase family protein